MTSYSAIIKCNVNKICIASFYRFILKNSSYFFKNICVSKKVI